MDRTDVSTGPAAAPEAEPKLPGTRNVIWLGFTSLFTDLSSGMIQPLVPLFLTGIGAPLAAIGLVEGVAQSAASVLRTVFGRWSDKAGKRKVFVFCGYGLSAITKPFLALAQVWTVVLGLKFSERVGKAVRTPARDALISTSVAADKKGRAFGFHRAMDRIGAVGGPLLAYLVLRLHGMGTAEGAEAVNVGAIRMAFLVSFVPAALALIFVAFAREPAASAKEPKQMRASGLAGPAFIVFVIATVVFTLGNSSNALLVLKPKQLGVQLPRIMLIWAFYNVFSTISSPIFGHLSDVIGRTPVIMASFIFYSLVYLGFGLATTEGHIWGLFGAYGIYYGLSNGIFRAYVADLVEPEYRATAYGILNTAIGLALLPASVIFMAVWSAFGSKYAFFVGAGFSMLGFLIFVVDLYIRSRTRGRASAEPTD